MLRTIVMEKLDCPKCGKDRIIKSGIINNRQRYKCKTCGYHFTKRDLQHRISKYYIIKSLQLYLEGLSLREIERILGVSHVSVSNWVKQYGLRKRDDNDYFPTYKILRHDELQELIANSDFLRDSGMIITELGDKYMIIRWERFKKTI